MVAADSFRKLARAKRALPGQFGLRPHRVYLVTAEWTGAYFGDGNDYPEEIEFTEGDGQPPKVRQSTAEERALGNLASGALEIGPITPSPAGPITAEMLRSADLTDNGQGRRLRITGPLMGDANYTIKSLRMDRALHWTITAEPSERVPA